MGDRRKRSSLGGQRNWCFADSMSRVVPPVEGNRMSHFLPACAALRAKERTRMGVFASSSSAMGYWTCRPT
jgi:hypothetical protein